MKKFSLVACALALHSTFALFCMPALGTPLPDGGFETLPLADYPNEQNGFDAPVSTPWVAHDDRESLLIPPDAYSSEVNVVGTVDGIGPVYGGSKQALITNGPSAGLGVALDAVLASPQLITEINAATGTLPDFTLAQLQALDLTVGSDPTEGAALSQSFTAEAGGTISFKYDFLTSEGARNDLAFFMLSYEGGVSSVTLLASVNGSTLTPVPSPSAFSRHLSSGPATFSMVLPGTGTLNYFIAMGVVDQGDALNTSGLLVDGLEVSTLFTGVNPEPSSAVLLMLGIAGLVGRGKRRRCRN